jgi:mannose-1-phosphate guanylyltransferase
MDVPEFQRVIKSALNFTLHSDAIVTLGMKPTRPETGYGYIEADLSTTSARNKEIYRVDSFKEKPDLATAEKYIKKNNYLWNAGIFVWNVNTIVNALRIYQPAISDIFENLLPYYGTPQQQERINQEFPKCENISVDYAILEKAEEIFVFPASFGWSDLGTWGSLHGQSKQDANHNVCIGQGIRLFETKNCLIHTTQEKRVVVQGLDGYIIAEKDNTLLICQMSEEQRIKQFSE